MTQIGNPIEVQEAPAPLDIPSPVTEPDPIPQAEPEVTEVPA